jgi:hypothetical protein
MEHLRIRVVTEYKMPPICCVCGAPSGPAKFRVSASSWSSRRPFSLYMPLCPECEAAYNTVDRRRRTGCWAGLGLAFVGATAGIIAQSLGANVPPGSGLVLALFFGGLLLGLIASLVIPRLFPAPAREGYQRVLHAVQIKDYSPAGPMGHGSMTLLFAHPPFAAAFRDANQHLIIAEP